MPGRRGFAVLIFFAAALLAGGYTLGKGRVIKAPDGDTLVMMTEGGSFDRVRLYGVDAPELHQKGGEAAAAFARDLALYKQVTVSVMDTDQYGRKVVLLRLPDGRTVNEELVRAGHAWVYRRYCSRSFCADWVDLEQQAKKRGLGLWADKNPQPPWQWRRAHPRR